MEKITAALLMAVIGLLLLGGCSANPMADRFQMGAPSHANDAGGGGGGGGGY